MLNKIITKNKPRLGLPNINETFLLIIRKLMFICNIDTVLKAFRTISILVLCRCTNAAAATDFDRVRFTVNLHTRNQ